MPKPRLGPLGEQFLRTIALEQGLIVNKSDDDTAGWDFIIQFPLPNTGEVQFIDLRPPSLEAWIQVKSTHSLKNKWPIKLDNATRLIQTPLPAFYLFLRFDGKSPVAAHLVHVDHALIGQTLRRLRQASLEGEAGSSNVDIRKKTITVSYGPAHELTDATGESLVAAIEKAVGRDMGKYSEGKLRALKTIGHEEGDSQITIRWKTSRDPEEELVDFALGIVDSIALDEFEIRPFRFGLASKAPISEHTGGSFSIRRRPSGTGELTLRASEGGHGVTFPVDLYGPEWVQHLVAKEKLRYYIFHKNARLVICPARSLATFDLKTPPAGDLCSLNELSLFGRLVAELETARTSTGYISAELRKRASNPLTFNMQPPELEKLTVSVGKSLVYAWKIARYFELEDRVFTSVQKLFREHDRHFAFASLIGLTDATPQLVVESYEPISERSVGAVIVANAILGEYSPVIAGAIVGTPEIVSGSNERPWSYSIGESRLVIVKKLTLETSNLSTFDASGTKSEVVDYLASRDIVPLL